MEVKYVCVCAIQWNIKETKHKAHETQERVRGGDWKRATRTLRERIDKRIPMHDTSRVCVCVYIRIQITAHTHKQKVVVVVVVVVGCPEVSRTVVGHRQQSSSSGGVASSAAAATAVVASVATLTYTATLIHCHRTCEQRLHLFFLLLLGKNPIGIKYELKFSNCLPVIVLFLLLFCYCSYSVAPPMPAHCSAHRI